MIKILQYVKTSLSNIETLLSVNRSTVSTRKIYIVISSDAHITDDLRDNFNFIIEG